MKTSRRKFISAAAAATVGAASPSILSCKKESGPGLSADEIRSRYKKLDGIIKQPVLKKDLFKEPVIIDTVELLHYDRSWLCRVRSKDGAEGMSVGHSTMSILFPLFLRNLQPFFAGQDARELDLILERVFIYNFNFRYNGITLGLPLATIEFAILDMLGRISGKPTAELI